MARIGKASTYRGQSSLRHGSQPDFVVAPDGVALDGSKEGLFTMCGQFRATLCVFDLSLKVDDVFAGVAPVWADVAVVAREPYGCDVFGCGCRPLGRMVTLLPSLLDGCSQRSLRWPAPQGRLQTACRGRGEPARRTRGCVRGRLGRSRVAGVGRCVLLKVLPADDDGGHQRCGVKVDLSTSDLADDEITLTRTQRGMVEPDADAVTNLRGTLKDSEEPQGSSLAAVSGHLVSPF